MRSLACLAMLLAASSMSAGAQAEQSPEAEITPQAQPFINAAEIRLLGGQPLEPDYRQHLLAMEPEQRLQAIVWLRRSGMLVDRTWSLDDLMRPATRPNQEVGDEPRIRGR